jgi:HAD superfamily hydrolase (TIGR01490 family)
MRLALFDLDHTLIPFDSGMAWLRFLIAHGRLPAHIEADYLAACQRYVAGEADLQALHHALLDPLREVPRGSLDEWLAAFEADLAGSLPGASRALVARHRDAGDRCVLVTATTRMVAERYAAAFGIEEVLASEALADSLGLLTGRIAGLPCAGPHKLTKLRAWLQLQELSLADFESSHFYTDAASDLPLLEAVSHPVAVRPDRRLLTIAQQRGWMIDTLEAATR